MLLVARVVPVPVVPAAARVARRAVVYLLPAVAEVSVFSRIEAPAVVAPAVKLFPVVAYLCR